MRLIFSRYLDFGSLSALQRDLRETGDRHAKANPFLWPHNRRPSSHQWATGLYAAQPNVSREINHRDKSYPGAHLPIIDEKLFEAVQAKLTADSSRGQHLQHQSSNALLMGKLFDDRGNAMTPTYAIKKGVRYSTPLASSPRGVQKEDAGSIPRVAAEAVERIVLDAIGALRPSKQIELRSSPPSAEVLNPDRDGDCCGTDGENCDRCRQNYSFFSVDQIRFLEGSDRPSKVIAIPWSPQTFRRKREVILPPSKSASGARPRSGLKRGNSYPPSPRGGDGSTK